MRECEIAALASKMVSDISTENIDVEIKIGALRSAADILQQSIFAETLRITVVNALLPKK